MFIGLQVVFKQSACFEQFAILVKFGKLCKFRSFLCSMPWVNFEHGSFNNWAKDVV